MFDSLKMDDFSLIIPTAEESKWLQELMQINGEKNRRFVPDTGSRPGRITGSFIYAHPPDYRGRPTHHYTSADWRALLAELKEMGIDTVVYQAAAWAEMQECYYPSRLFSHYKTWNSLPALFDAAAAEGMTLYMGGLGSGTAFDPTATAEMIDAERDLQLACFKELLAYRGGFQGYYVSPETAFAGTRQPERERLLNRYFTQICQGVKELAPELPILMSPGTFYTTNHDEENFEFLYHLLAGCPVDFVAPQDSIGTFSNSLPDYKASFDVWRKVAKAAGFTLWVNVESFQRVRIRTDSDFVPADFERLKAQIEMASLYGEKLISWEVPYFYSPHSGERGIHLRKTYMEYIQQSTQ